MVPRLPNWVNESLIHLNLKAEWVYGNKYKDYKKFYQNNFKAYDNESKLIEMVNYSIEHVPYYRERYEKITSLSDFESQIEFIDRDTISDNFDKLQSDKIKPNQYDLVTTGGTTGKPLRLLLKKNRYIIEKATVHQLWKNVGFNHHIRAVLRNHKLPKSKTYRINSLTKEYLFDGFRMDDEYYEQVYIVLRKKKIKYIHAYPSNAYTFSKFLKRNNLDTSFIRAFISSSENVYPYQKDFIEKEAKIKFYNFYGHSEKIIIGGYCHSSDYYHIEPTYGYFELIDENGKPIKTPGKIGEMVGTTLNNFGMPLIRYRTDDYAEYAGEYCAECGRHLPLLKTISGRWSGRKIFGTDNKTTTPTALNVHDELFTVIDGLQYVQEKKGDLIVRIVKGKNFSEKHERQVLKHYKDKLPPSIKAEIHYIDKIQKQKNGKFLDLISKIS